MARTHWVVVCFGGEADVMWTVAEVQALGCLNHCGGIGWRLSNGCRWAAAGGAATGERLIERHWTWLADLMRCSHVLPCPQVFEAGDSGLRLPVVLQQYIPHGSILTKVTKPLSD